jgi:hypothetical protein
MLVERGREPLPQEPAWSEPPPSFVAGSLGLAERLLEYAEAFANEGDLLAACSRARCALEGLEALPSDEGPSRALCERARRELSLYEARRAKWREEKR